MLSARIAGTPARQRVPVWASQPIWAFCAPLQERGGNESAEISAKVSTTEVSYQILNTA
jgi:hypothetical protein